MENNRANWSDPIQRKYFIDLCLHEANNGNRSGATLRPCAWSRISQELKMLTGKCFTQKQLKNGWDYMKRQYAAWAKLIREAGHDFNYATQSFDWPPERWDEYIKKYPKTKQFRHRPLANAKELKSLFAEVLLIEVVNSSSDVGGTPKADNQSSTFSTRMSSKTPINLEDKEYNMPKTSQGEYKDLDEPIVDEVQGHEKKPKNTNFSETPEEITRLLHVLEKIERPSIKECMEVLEKLITYEDPLYYAAINLFCKKKAYREVWMNMKSDQARIGWIHSLPKNL